MDMTIRCSGTENGDDTGIHKRVEIQLEDETTQPELPRFSFPTDKKKDDDDGKTPQDTGAD